MITKIEINTETTPHKIYEFKDYFSQEGVLFSEIREKYGDLRMLSTWKRAYGDYTFEKLPLIQAIAELELSPSLSTSVSSHPTPTIFEPVVHLEKEEELNLGGKRMLGGGRKEYLQPLPPEHRQLLMAVLFAENVLPELLIKHDEPTILISTPTTARYLFLPENNLLSASPHTGFNSELVGKTFVRNSQA